MLRPRGRLQVHAGLPRALLLYGGHAGGRGLAQVEGDAGCALRGRAADGAARGWVALGAAQLRLAEEDLHSRQELGHHAACVMCVARSVTVCRQPCAPARAGRRRTRASRARERPTQLTSRNMRESGGRAAHSGCVCDAYTCDDHELRPAPRENGLVKSSSPKSNLKR